MSRQFTWGDSSMATQRDDRQRPLPSAQCSLCGIALPTGLLVPDGGQACADIRWYCKDAKSCTERWTASLPRHPHIAPTPASLAPRRPGSDGGADAGTSRPGHPVPEDAGSAPEEAWSIDPLRRDTRPRRALADRPAAKAQPAHAGDVQDGPVAAVRAVAVQAGHLDRPGAQVDLALVAQVQVTVHQPAGPHRQHDLAEQVAVRVAAPQVRRRPPGRRRAGTRARSPPGIRA